MNPGLVVKLRPTGPWRIGPDSGARNRVDTIYHSDTLYAAVTGALGRLGPMEDWLAATARNSAPAVCFSSCFPFMDEIGFIVPPRTVWPPTSPALLSARVRWKSARFVPLGLVPEILAGRALDDSQWNIDAASECLVPAGRSGPFRTGMRSNAAIDRLNGSSERHSTACIEFRSGAGLWTIVSFADEAAAARWMTPVKTAFRLLADSGFGGERSRGWGRSEMPEFIDGTLPEMILPAVAAEQIAPSVTAQQPPLEEPPDEEKPPVEEPPSEQEPSPEEPPREEPATEAGEAALEAAMIAPVPIAPLSTEMAEAELSRIAVEAEGKSPDPAPESEPPLPPPDSGHDSEPLPNGPGGHPGSDPSHDADPSRDREGADSPSEAPAIEVSDAAIAPPGPESPAEAVTDSAPHMRADAPAPEPSDAAIIPPGPEPHLPRPDPEPQPEPAPPVPVPPTPEPEPAPQPEPGPPPPAPIPPVPEPQPEPRPEPGPPFPEPLPAAPPPTPAAAAHPHWLLSLFTPAPTDSVDWTRGSYSVVARGGRIESPVRSGERKKQLPMIAEGSVLYASAPPAGSAPDVAPDDFVHPVYRAGFALSIPLPEAI